MRRILCALVLVFVSSVACQPGPSATPTMVFTPTEEIPPEVFTPTATLTPDQATATPTYAQPSQTPTVTQTPVATPTCICAPCPPVPTPNVADAILRACLDDDHDDLCDLPIVPISMTAVLTYQGTPLWGIEATTGQYGMAILSALPAGVYTVVLLGYDDPQPGQPGACRVPYHDTPGWAMLSGGQQEVLLFRFWQLQVCVTPVATATRTVTPTPIVAYSPTATRTVIP